MLVVHGTHDKESPYTMIGNNIIGMHSALSVNERAVLCLLLSLPGSWDVSTRGLASLLPMCKETVAKTVKALEKKGYIIRHAQGLDVNGKFQSATWEVFEKPHTMPTRANEHNPRSGTCPNISYTMPTRANEHNPRSGTCPKFPLTEISPQENKDHEKSRGENGGSYTGRNVQHESDSQLIPRGIQCIKCGAYIPQDGGISIDGLPVCDACYTRDFVRRAI